MSKLDMIGAINGTDKSSCFSFSWDYLRSYEKFFEKWQKEAINIIEIGIAHGSSLKTWLEYFEKATYIGIDIDPNCRNLSRDRAVIMIGSQEDPAFLQRIAAQYPPTIIIDDGSHVAHHMIASFATLFPSLLPGGVYIFEDLSFHFEDGVGQWQGAKKHQGLASTSIYEYLSRFVRARAANVSLPKDSWGFERYAFEQIDSITAFGGAIAVTKRAPQDFDTAIATAEAKLAKSARKSDVPERYAIYLMKHDINLERAEALLIDVLTADPAKHTARALLVDLMVRLGRLDEAAEAANELVRLNGSQSYWWHLLAKVERDRNRPDKELVALTQLSSLEPHSPSLHDRLSVVHESLGDFAAALTAARKAVELQPESIIFKNRVEKLKRDAAIP